MASVSTGVIKREKHACAVAEDPKVQLDSAKVSGNLVFWFPDQRLSVLVHQKPASQFVHEAILQPNASV